MHLDHYVGVFDNVLNENECKRIINRFESLCETSDFRQVYDGSQQFQQGKLGRSDTSLFFEQVAQDENEFIQNKVGECVQAYGKEYVGLQNQRMASFACKVQRTSSRGGYHVWHAEHGGDLSSMRRILVWILYLTTHEGSGETEFLQQGLRVKPQAGRVVIWPASFTHPHRGNPVYEGTKYIATGWYEHYHDVQA